MQFSFKNKSYELPNMLGKITLGQRIEFYKKYGAALDKELQDLNKIEDEMDKDAESTQWYYRLAAQTLSFYTGIPLESVLNEMPLKDVLMVFNSNQAVLREQEDDISLQRKYEFNGETWHIAPPELTAESDMTFNEFLHAKEIVRQMKMIAAGNWEPLQYLSAIYLRKKDEKFSEELIKTDSDRLKLMKDLPLDIALAVGFFLTSTMTIYIQDSQSLRPEPVEMDQIPANISIDGDGSPSSPT